MRTVRRCLPSDSPFIRAGGTPHENKKEYREVFPVHCADYLFGIRELVEAGISEIECNVDRDLDEVENIEEEAEEKDESRAASGSLDDLSDYAEHISDEKKHLKEEALSLRGA